MAACHDVVGTPVTYSGSPEFKSKPGDQLTEDFCGLHQPVHVKTASFYFLTKSTFTTVLFNLQFEKA
jgi:hypothetical protein